MRRITIFPVCQKIIQNSSARHFPCDGSQHSAEGDIKFPVPVITKAAHLHNKEVESTNSLKANVSVRVIVSPVSRRTLRVEDDRRLNYSNLSLSLIFRQTSEKDEDSRSIHNSSMPNDSGLLNDNFHNMQNQHGELRTSILTPTTIRCGRLFFSRSVT